MITHRVSATVACAVVILEVLGSIRSVSSVLQCKHGSDAIASRQSQVQSDSREGSSKVGRWIMLCDQMVMLCVDAYELI
jgi:hypothetical protein